MQVIGNIGGVEYKIEQSVIDEAKELHGIDVVEEVKDLLLKELANNPDLMSMKEEDESKRT